MEKTISLRPTAHGNKVKNRDLAVSWLTESVLNGRVSEHHVEMGDKKDKKKRLDTGQRPSDAKVSIPQNPMGAIT